jgi:D-threonate/D-erythronate kinase
VVVVLAAVLADDLTGALEVGALAATVGLPVLVHLDPSGPFADGDVAVIDTETRRPSRDGVARFASALDACLPAAPWIYKKVDSTLRGPIAAELVALVRALPSMPIVYVPAYPALGRTVVGGELLVNGEPVAQTAFADDVYQPIRSSTVVDLFAGVVPPGCVRSCTPTDLVAALAEMLPAGRCGTVLVCDAETDADLDEIAAALRPIQASVLVAGSGGFAARWLATVPGGRRATPPCGRPRLPAIGSAIGSAIRSAIVVCGSRHPVSIAQAEAAAAVGYRCLVPATGENADPIALADELGRRAAAAIAEQRPDVVVLFGGDTAFVVLRALGCDTLRPIGEVLPGVPVARGENSGLVVVTKAGGFGEVDVVATVMERLG